MPSCEAFIDWNDVGPSSCRRRITLLNRLQRHLRFATAFCKRSQASQHLGRLACGRRIRQPQFAADREQFVQGCEVACGDLSPQGHREQKAREGVSIGLNQWLKNLLPMGAAAVVFKEGRNPLGAAGRAGCGLNSRRSSRLQGRCAQQAYHGKAGFKRRLSNH